MQRPAKIEFLAVFVCCVVLGIALLTAGFAENPEDGPPPPLAHAKMIALAHFDETWTLGCHLFTGKLRKDTPFEDITCKGNTPIQLHLLRKLASHQGKDCSAFQLQEDPCLMACVEGEAWEAQLFDWKIARCTLAQEAVLQGIAFRPGDQITLNREGNLQTALYAKPRLLFLPSPAKSQKILYRSILVSRETFDQIHKTQKPRPLKIKMASFQCLLPTDRTGLVCAD